MRITDYRLFNINDDDDTRKIWVDIERNIDPGKVLPKRKKDCFKTKNEETDINKNDTKQH